MNTINKLYEYIRTYPIAVPCTALLIGWCIPVWYISLTVVVLSVVCIVGVHEYTRHQYALTIDAMESANEELRIGVDSAVGSVYAQYAAVKAVNKTLSAKQASSSKPSITRRQFVNLVEQAFYWKDHSREVIFNGTRVIFVGHAGGVKELSTDGVKDSVSYKPHKRMAAQVKPQLPVEPEMPPLYDEYLNH
jgi:hypothetical protein